MKGAVRVAGNHGCRELRKSPFLKLDFPLRSSMQAAIYGLATRHPSNAGMSPPASASIQPGLASVDSASPITCSSDIANTGAIS